MERRAGPSEYLALVALGVGALATVLAVLSFRAFDLDRFFAPKELALHASALVAGVALLAGTKRLALRRADLALAAWLALSFFTAVFATNHWLAFRALTLTVSGAVVFWSARRLAAAGLSGALTTVLAVAVVAGALTALAQAYGVKMEFAALNRAPGGTFGNRNFMAHLTAIGVPLLLYRLAVARSSVAAAIWMTSLAACSGAIVLSRSRAAWLALAVCGVLGLLVASRGPALLEGPDGLQAKQRLWRGAAVAALGVALALGVPNVLDWRSESPYLESVRGVVNFREGSGKGRLRQYANTARMAVAHPALGVGPGNWPVAYPRFAPGDDPSLAEGTGMTANPWPSSDWMAALSERGVPATLSLAGFVALLVLGALRARYDPSRSAVDRLGALAGVGVLGIAVVEGGFDAVLLLPAPALVVWAAAGALIPGGREVRGVALPNRSRAALTIATGAFCLAAAHAGSRRIEAMRLYGKGTLAALEDAIAHDPGSYRIRMRAAEAYAARGRCGDARRHALVARDLLPAAPAPKRVLDRCR
jgi:O-antigen ligase